MTKRWHECTLDELRKQLPTFTLKRLREKFSSIPVEELPDLLASDEVQSRLESLQAEAKPELHKFEPTPQRKSHIKGSGRRYVVLNRQGVAISTTRDEETAQELADLLPGRQALDLGGLSLHQRIKLSNALARRFGSQRFEPPKPRQQPYFEPKEKRDQKAEMLAELQAEVDGLHLAADQATALFKALRGILFSLGREQALDLIHEVSVLQYTDVLDLASGQRFHFEDCYQAARVSRRLIEQGAFLYDDKGRCTFKYRFKTVKPEAI